MPKVMSPLAPERETRGAKAAQHYYQIMHLLSSKQIIASALLLYLYLCNVYGYEFANEFLDWATIIAKTRATRNI